MTKLTVLDLFSGVGGFSLGLERTGGFETVSFVEIDKHCQKVLNKHWPDVPIIGDISKVAYYDELEKDHPLGCRPNLWDYTEAPNPGAKVVYSGYIDILCGGFPCQDISVANVNGKGLEGERSGLWSEYARLIDEVRPRYAIIENVANLRNKGLAKVLHDLNSIGYNARFDIIPSRAVGGPSLRERIWIVASPNRNVSRLWETNATKEARQKWGTKARFEPTDWRIDTPEFCRMDDGFPKELDKGRRARIHQMGNAVDPRIPYLIGQAILELEQEE